MGVQFSKLPEAYEIFWSTIGLPISAEFGLVGAGSIFRCGLLSFLAYFVPLSILKRKYDSTLLRSALAFGSFSFAYRAARILVARLAPPQLAELHKEAPFLAGVVGALTATAIDPSFVSSLFIIWWCIRALRTVPALHFIEESRIGTPLIMCMATDVLSSAGYRSPEDHHPQYRKFFESFFEVSGDRMEAFRSPPPGVSVMRNVVGRNRSLALWVVRYVAHVALQCVRMYAPLHLLWAAFRLPARTPLSVIAANTARSTLFLTTYVSSLMAMLFANSYFFAPSPPRWQVQLWGWISGLSVLLERPNRQAELAFFCSSHAINSLYNHAVRVGLVRPNQVVGVALLCVATGQIMKHNAERPGRTMHLLFGEKRGRKSQVLSQRFGDDTMRYEDQRSTSESAVLFNEDKIE